MTLSPSEKIVIRTRGQEAPHVQWFFRNRVDQERASAICGWKPEGGWRGWQKDTMTLQQFYDNPPRVCLNCRAILLGGKP